MILVVLCAIIGYATCQPCGITPIPPHEARIVGGTVAIPYSWPWQVVFCVMDTPGGICSLECGGSIISPNWVITAGHCVYGNTGHPSYFKIKAGVFNESDINEKNEAMISIAQIILHPQYDPDTISHDISLLKLATPLTFSDHIQPVCLASSDSVLTPGTMVTVTGWGTTNEGGDISEQLRQVQVPMVAQNVCDSEYAGQIQDDVMFCAGVGGKDSCQGDSGGPVVLKHFNGLWYEHGLTSWGQGCAETGHPGVYSRISAYCGFIQQYTGVSCMN